MSDFVLDASLSLQWFLKDEAGREYSLKVLSKLSRDRALVPVIWFYEMSNGLLIAQRRGRLTKADLQDFLSALPRIALDIEPCAPEHLMRITNLAARSNLAVYDAAYLDLAVEKGLPLATVDAALLKAAKQAGISPFQP